MPIVVRMKVILSPPGLILKERPADGSRVHEDAGRRQVTDIQAWTGVKVSYSIA
jgi:hypothetical protein